MDQCLPLNQHGLAAGFDERQRPSRHTATRGRLQPVPPAQPVPPVRPVPVRLLRQLARTSAPGSAPGARGLRSPLRTGGGLGACMAALTCGPSPGRSRSRRKLVPPPSTVIKMMQVHRRSLAGLRDLALNRITVSTPVFVGGQGDGRELLDLHGGAERREELRDAVLAVTHAVPRCGGRGGFRRPVNIAGDGVEDRGDIAAAECLIYPARWF